MMIILEVDFECMRVASSVKIAQDAQDARNAKKRKDSNLIIEIDQTPDRTQRKIDPKDYDKYRIKIPIVFQKMLNRRTNYSKGKRKMKIKEIMYVVFTSDTFNMLGNCWFDEYELAHQQFPIKYD